MKKAPKMAKGGKTKSVGGMATPFTKAVAAGKK